MAQVLPLERSVIDLSEKLLCMRHLMSHIRDNNTQIDDFRRYSDRLMRILCEETLAYTPLSQKIITTPTLSQYSGCVLNESNLVAISIVRSGDSSSLN